MFRLKDLTLFMMQTSDLTEFMISDPFFLNTFNTERFTSFVFQMERLPRSVIPFFVFLFVVFFSFVQWIEFVLFGNKFKKKTGVVWF